MNQPDNASVRALIEKGYEFSHSATRRVDCRDVTVDHFTKDDRFLATIVYVDGMALTVEEEKAADNK